MLTQLTPHRSTVTLQDQPSASQSRRQPSSPPPPPPQDSSDAEDEADEGGSNPWQTDTQPSARRSRAIAAAYTKAFGEAPPTTASTAHADGNEGPTDLLSACRLSDEVLRRSWSLHRASVRAPYLPCMSRAGVRRLTSQLRSLTHLARILIDGQPAVSAALQQEAADVSAAGGRADDVGHMELSVESADQLASALANAADLVADFPRHAARSKDAAGLGVEMDRLASDVARVEAGLRGMAANQSALAALLLSRRLH